MTTEWIKRLRAAQFAPPGFDYGRNCETVPVEAADLRTALAEIAELEREVEALKSDVTTLIEACSDAHGETQAAERERDGMRETARAVLIGFRTGKVFLAPVSGEKLVRALADALGTKVYVDSTPIPEEPD